MKQILLSISACALRYCSINNENVISFEKLHQNNKKCTTLQIMAYQSALQLHKTPCFESHNFTVPSFESMTVINQMPITNRQTNFPIFRDNATNIGMNTTANKFYQLSGKISLNSLGLHLSTIKNSWKYNSLNMVIPKNADF